VSAARHIALVLAWTVVFWAVFCGVARLMISDTAIGEDEEAAVPARQRRATIALTAVAVIEAALVVIATWPKAGLR
jgi:fatty acid desaturase